MDYLNTGRAIAASVAFLAAGYVAVKGKEGWGWLIFAGVLVIA